MTNWVYIVIPTRNRHDTLRHAIRTALQQEFDQLRVIVSDNASSPATRAVFEEFSDSRLTYQRSDRPLSMMDSWEFALSAVNEPGFVHFMGDDNGLTPNAVQRVVAAAAVSGLRVVHGDVVQYCWPGQDRPHGELYVPPPRRDRIIDSAKARRSVYRQRIGFDRLPTINVAFVHSSVINEVRARTGGRYFCASNPDVFSAGANGFVIDRYAYLGSPFMINGASRHSNGASAAQVSPSTFIEDTIAGGYGYPPEFPPSRIYLTNVFEALWVAANYFEAPERRLIDLQRILDRTIAQEYVALGRTWLEPGIKAFAAANNLRLDLPAPGRKVAADGNRASATPACGGALFDGPAYPLADVYEASLLAGKYYSELFSGARAGHFPLRERIRSFVRDAVLMGGRHKPLSPTNGLV